MPSLSDHMNKLRQVLELPREIPKDDEGVWRLWIDDDRSIVITDTEPGYHLYCQLAPVKPGSHEELFTVLMVNNLLGQGTNGAVLGLNDAGSQVTLSLSRSENADYNAFEADIEDFLNNAYFWSKQVESLQQESKRAYL